MKYIILGFIEESYRIPSDRDGNHSAIYVFVWDK